MRIPPGLSCYHLEGDELNAATEVRQALSGLSSYATNIESAIQLFQWSGQEISGHLASSERPRSDSTISAIRLLNEWRGIAARDAVMSIYHFGQIRDLLVTYVVQSSWVSRFVERESLKISGKLFQQYFPDWAKLRHSVAHSGEFLAKQSKRKRHSTTNEISDGMIRSPIGNQVFIFGNIDGDTFSCTFEGKVRSFDLNHQTLSNLHEVITEIFSPFQQAEDAMTRENLRLFRLNRPQSEQD